MKIYSEHIENNIRLDQTIGLEIQEEQQCSDRIQFLKIYT